MGRGGGGGGRAACSWTLECSKETHAPPEHHAFNCGCMLFVLFFFFFGLAVLPLVPFLSPLPTVLCFHYLWPCVLYIGILCFAF